MYCTQESGKPRGSVGKLVETVEARRKARGRPRGEARRKAADVVPQMKDTMCMRILIFSSGRISDLGKLAALNVSDRKQNLHRFECLQIGRMCTCMQNM